MNRLLFKQILLFLIVFHIGNLYAQETDLRLYEAVQNPRVIKLSEIASEVTFVWPEKTRYSYIPPISSLENKNAYFLLEDKILYVGYYLLLFDRKTGEYIRQIGAKSGNPNRDLSFYYDYTGANSPYYEREGKIMTYNSRFFLEYDLLTNKPKVYPRPTTTNKDTFLGRLNKDVIVSLDRNTKGNSAVKLYFQNKDSVFMTSPQHHHFDPKRISTGLHGGTYYFRDNLFLFDECNDTVFHITSTGERASYLLGRGTKGITNQQIIDFRTESYQKNKRSLYNEKVAGYFTDFHICENDSFILFSFKYDSKNYAGYYSKKAEETHVAGPDKSGNTCFVNDLQKGFPLFPSKWTINNKNELIGEISVEDIHKWIEANGTENIDSKYLKLKAKDNPVLMILKLK
ncbi:hypothetical protein LJC43_00355 [Parabacteroides sp. OttesenSCG-928-G21]|nr:hypothetical protein [Parabacteroides sp. OttesenSCG-928-G21]